MWMGDQYKTALHKCGWGFRGEEKGKEGTI